MATEQEGQRLSQEIREAYGTDVIIVYKPEGLDYFVTTSTNSPACTKRILRELVLERMTDIGLCETCGKRRCKLLPLRRTDG